MSLEKCYTVDEVAATLRVSRATVDRLILKGSLRSFRVGSRVRVAESALNTFMADGPTPTIPGRSKLAATLLPLKDHFS